MVYCQRCWCLRGIGSRGSDVLHGFCHFVLVHRTGSEVVHHGNVCSLRYVVYARTGSLPDIVHICQEVSIYQVVDGSNAFLTREGGGS